MATTDKNKAVLEFLSECPAIAQSKVFLNFGNIKEGSVQANINSDDKYLHRRFIDGSAERRFTFSVDLFKSVAYNPIVRPEPGDNSIILDDENTEEFAHVQSVLDWINEQDELENYPNFGEGYIVEHIETTTTKPEIYGINTETNPPLAVYRISIQIDYIDNTQRIWEI